MKKLKMARSVTLTFEEGCNKYLDNCRARNLREGTLKPCAIPPSRNGSWQSTLKLLNTALKPHTRLCVHAEPEEEKMKMTDFDIMLECIAIAFDEHGMKADDGHWMTDAELIALPEKEVITLFNLIYGRG